MSLESSHGRTPGGACEPCLRRSWLLARLVPVLDRCCRDGGRALELALLEDEQLIAAVAGRERRRLQESWRRFAPGAGSAAVEGAPAWSRPGVKACRDAGAGARASAPQQLAVALCPHRDRLPRTLHAREAPPCAMFAHPSAVARLARCAGRDVVVIAGSRRGSDYGREVASSLARSLALAGVVVASVHREGIGAAALEGALQAGAAPIALLPDGPGARPPARASLAAHLEREGIPVSTLPPGAAGRQWGPLDAAATLVRLATLTVLVEADGRPQDLAAAAAARAAGAPLAAVPNRISSPLATGTHALLRAGAPLIRGPEDVIDALFAAGGAPGRALGSRAHGPDLALTPLQRHVLDRVARGDDTPHALCRDGAEPAAVLQALSELELLGALARGEAGRYIPRLPRPWS